MQAARDRSPRPDPSALNYEEAVRELESIIERLEKGEVDLEESLAEYRRGATLLRRCRSILDVAEQEVQKLAAEDEEGGAGPGGPSRAPGPHGDDEES